MSISRVVEYVFFFLLLAGAGFLVWQIFSPFIGALALSLIIVVICYPLHERFLRISYKRNKSIAAALSTLSAVIIIVLPLVLISSVLVGEVANFYQSFSSGQEITIERFSTGAEQFAQTYIPGFELNLTEQIKRTAEWLVSNLGVIFAGTLSTVLTILLSLVSSFYFFRDGKNFVKFLINVSPLPDREDEIIINRLAKSVRSVVTGVVLISLLQGVLIAIGFAIFGIDRAVLWGAIGAILAMLPGLGTTTIMVPGVIYLFLTGATAPAIGLLIYTLLIIIIVDNFIAPHLMSRGNNLHPFIVLISVLGGVSTFGPIGFIVGPVIVTLFVVLLEVYHQYIVKDRKRDK